MATDPSNTTPNFEPAFSSPFDASGVGSPGVGSPMVEPTAGNSLWNQPQRLHSQRPDASWPGTRALHRESAAGQVTDQGTLWNNDGAIEFRVRSLDHPTRRLRLAGARYTLGSGAGCSIRLDDPSLRPLHAVLIRDANRILIRAYSIPLLINDVRVTEGTLMPGDSLRLGNYEFELIGSNTGEPNPSSPVAKASNHRENHTTAHRFTDAPTPADGMGSGSVFDSGEEFRREAQRWHKLKEDVEQRDRLVRMRQSELQKKSAQIEEQFTALNRRQQEIDSQESAAVELHNEFQLRHEALIARQEELVAQQAELLEQREELRKQQTRLQGRDDRYRLQVEELLHQQERTQAREEQNARRLEETREQLRASQAQADAASEAVSQMRTKFASLNEQLLALGDQQESLQQLDAQRVETHRKACNDLANARDEAIAQRDLANVQRDEAVDAKASSDAQLLQAESRCDDLLRSEESLRDEIEVLQTEIADARKEAESLRRDCQLARDTIEELESRVRESDHRDEANRTSWNAEVDALRQSVDELSVNLANAEQQLTQLREDNEKLRVQLTTATDDRDELKTKFRDSEQKRIAAERQVTETRNLFDRSNRDHDDTLGQIERLEQETRGLIDAKTHREADQAVPASSIRLGLVSSFESPDEPVDEVPEELTGHQAVEENQVMAEVEAEPVTEAEEVAHLDRDEDESIEQNQFVEEVQAAAISSPLVWTDEPAVDESDDDVWPTYDINQASETQIEEIEEPPIEEPLDNLIGHDDEHQVTQDQFIEKQISQEQNNTPLPGTPAWPSETESHLLPEDRQFEERHFERHLDGQALKGQTLNADASVFDPVNGMNVNEVDFADRDLDLAPVASHFASEALTEGNEIRDEPTPAEWQVVDESEAVDDSALASFHAESDELPVDLVQPNHIESVLSEAEHDLGYSTNLDEAESAGMTYDHPEAFVDVASVDQHSAQPAAGSLADQLIRDLRAEKAAVDYDENRHADLMHGPRFLTQDEVEPSVPEMVEDAPSMDNSGTQMWDGTSDYVSDANNEIQTEPSGDAYAFDAEPAEEIDSIQKQEELSGTQLQSWESSNVEEEVHEPSLVDEPEYDEDSQSSEVDVVQAETPPSDPEPDDDSIEAYMNRLLQRVQKQDESEESPVAKPTKSSPKKVTTTDSSVESEVKEVVVAEAVDPDAPLVPRSQAPERNSNLSAMRALANESARSAVARSAKTQTHSSRVQAMVKFAQAGVAVICGIAAVALVHQGMLKIIAAVAALMIAAICVKEGIGLLSASLARQQVRDVSESELEGEAGAVE